LNQIHQEAGTRIYLFLFHYEKWVKMINPWGAKKHKDE